MNRDVMIDLETLSSSPRTAIVQIGACVFDRFTGEIFQKFKATTKPDLSRYDVSYDTLAWWFRQSQGARKSVMPEEFYQVVDLQKGLEDFTRCFMLWHTDPDTVRVWAMPTTFDNVILEHALRTELDFVPWKHSNARDARTIFEAAGIEREDRVKPELAHDALSDAVAQAKTVAKAHRRLRAGGRN